MSPEGAADRGPRYLLCIAATTATSFLLMRCCRAELGVSRDGQILSAQPELGGANLPITSKRCRTNKCCACCYCLAAEPRWVCQAALTPLVPQHQLANASVVVGPCHAVLAAAAFLQGRGGFAKLRSHPWFRSINWAELQEGRSMLPLGLRERLFHSGGGGELGFWTPQPVQAGAPNPTWLEEF
jgi:hypothetical protein